MERMRKRLSTLLSVVMLSVVTTGVAEANMAAKYKSNSGKIKTNVSRKVQTRQAREAAATANQPTEVLSGGGAATVNQASQPQAPILSGGGQASNPQSDTPSDSGSAAATSCGDNQVANPAGGCACAPNFQPDLGNLSKLTCIRVAECGANAVSFSGKCQCSGSGYLAIEGSSPLECKKREATQVAHDCGDKKALNFNPQVNNITLVHDAKLCKYEGDGAGSGVAAAEVCGDVTASNYQKPEPPKSVHNKELCKYSQVVEVCGDQKASNYVAAGVREGITYKHNNSKCEYKQVSTPSLVVVKYCADKLATNFQSPKQESGKQFVADSKSCVYPVVSTPVQLVEVKYCADAKASNYQVPGKVAGKKFVADSKSCIYAAVSTPVQQNPVVKTVKYCGQAGATNYQKNPVSTSTTKYVVDNSSCLFAAVSNPVKNSPATGTGTIAIKDAGAVNQPVLTVPAVKPNLGGSVGTVSNKPVLTVPAVKPSLGGGKSIELAPTNGSSGLLRAPASK